MPGSAAVGPRTRRTGRPQLDRRPDRLHEGGLPCLLHELAISVPVLAGFALPLLYFTLYAVLLLVERALEKAGHPVTDWGRWSHVWVIGWLALPVPILFHGPFLRGVIWPLIGGE